MNKKIVIPSETWVELYSELAAWHVQEAQVKFEEAAGDVENILEDFFEKGEA